MAGYWLAIGWLLAGYQLVIGWLLDGYQLAISYLLADHGLGTGLLSAINWLAIGWLLAGYVPKSIHFKTVIYYYVPKWHMAAINTLKGSVFTKCFGYRLAIGLLCCKINTLQHIVIYYYVSKWHMTAINTLDNSVFTRFFGSWLAMSQK